VKDALKTREEFRRDGLAANFLVDGNMMACVARAFPGSILNVGYPAACTAEKERVSEILAAIKGLPVEPGLYSHAKKNHLEVVGSLLENYPGASVCFWVPTSRKFIQSTLKKPPEEVVRLSVDLVKYFKSNFQNNIDVALADTTLKEEGLIERVAEMSAGLHQAGARSVIACDTRGIGTADRVERLFGKIRESDQGELEYHPHTDNGLAAALANVEIARGYGVGRVNTALYNSSERATLIEPRDLIAAGYEIDFVPEELAAFEREYRDKVGDPKQITEAVYGKRTIATGSQYRLQERFKNARLIFGVTSDKFILSKLLDRPLERISDTLLDSMKGELYKQRKVFFTGTELKQQFENRESRGEIGGEYGSRK
jgi:hypothetical protein